MRLMMDSGPQGYQASGVPRWRRRHRCRALADLWLGLALTAALAGCQGEMRPLTPEEEADFDQAGFIAPQVDLNRIEQAQLKKGPYRVVPGDVLEFTMPSLLQAVTQQEVVFAQTRNGMVNPYQARVHDNGTIVLPAVGTMAVAGLSLSEIEERVAQAYKSYVVVDPSVFVRVAEYKTERVYIAGAVKTPGVYALQANQMTLSYLLTQAGGISEAGAAVVRVVRATPPASAGATVVPVSLTAPAGPDAGPELLGPRPEAGRVPPREEMPWGSPGTYSLQPTIYSSANPPALPPLPATELRAAGTPALGGSAPQGTPARVGDPKPIILPVVSTNIPYRDIALDEGDTVVVEPVQMPLFSVLGLVAKPGNFPYPPGAQYNLTQAIAFAGGLDTVTRPHYVTIYRLRTDGTIARAPFRLIRGDKFTEALGTPIRPGDVVAVEHTLRTHINMAIRDLLRIDAGLYISGQDLGITRR